MSKATDYRLSIGYVNHPKLRLLKSELGAEAAWCHLTLVEYCAVNKPDGKLHGMSIRLIESAANWTGAPGAFVAALVGEDIQLLDETADGLEMHDWANHQPWVAGSLDRAEQAKKAGIASGKSRRGANAEGTDSEPDTNSSRTDSELNSESVQQVCSISSAECEPHLLSDSFPSPSPNLTESNSESFPKDTECAPDPKNKAVSARYAPKAFDSFMLAFPKSSDRRDAAKAWDSERPSEQDVQSIMRHLLRFGGKRLDPETQARVKEAGQWLRARRWEHDDPFPGLTILAEQTAVREAIRPVSRGNLREQASHYTDILRSAVAQ